MEYARITLNLQTLAPSRYIITFPKFYPIILKIQERSFRSILTFHVYPVRPKSNLELLQHKANSSQKK